MTNQWKTILFYIVPMILPSLTIYWDIPTEIKNIYITRLVHEHIEVYAYSNPAQRPFSNPVHLEDYEDVSSSYGVRSQLHSQPVGGAVHIIGPHNGVDLTGTRRARIKAVADGVVIDHWVPPRKGTSWEGHEIYGGYIRILHDNNWISGYAHLSESIKITEGTWVKRGQTIGRMGNTGKSYGEHLHFMLTNPQGKKENPLKFIRLDT